MNKTVWIVIVAIAIVSLLFIFGWSKKAHAPVSEDVKESETLVVNNNKEEKMENTNSVATITTNLGVIKIELFADKAPNTVANFVKLSNEGFYNNTKFHRIIKDFMIQGGDPLSKDDAQINRWGTGGPGYVFNDEQNDVALVNGVIAMANAGPNTNGSQFFIITAEATPWLQGKHTGFGKVIEGLDIVEKIGNVETGAQDRPVEAVVLQSVEIK
jgi:cyclophilin family peptidyl-prolyl cis-trans isomerase